MFKPSIDLVPPHMDESFSRQMGQAPSESWPRVPGGLIWAPRRWVNQKRFQMIGSKVFETNAIENTDSRLYIYIKEGINLNH